MSWRINDSRLNSLELDSPLIWTPSVFLLSPLEEDQQLSSHVPPVTSLSKGSVRWAIKTRLDSHCNLTFDSFPFDRHQCTLLFGSWLPYIQLQPGNQTGCQEITSSAWSIESSELRNPTNFKTNESDHRHLLLTLKIARTSNIYQQFMKFTLYTLVILPLLIFCLPPKCLQIRLCLSLFCITLSLIASRESSYFIGFSENSVLQTFLTWIIVISLIDCFFSFLVYCIGCQVYETPLPMILATFVNGIPGKMLILQQTAIPPSSRHEIDKNRNESNQSLCIFLQHEWLLFAVLLDRLFFFVHITFFWIITPSF